MSKIETKIKELNIKLPDPKPPVGAYVATKIIGNLLFISGQISADENLNLIKGKVGEEFTYPVNFTQDLIFSKSPSQAFFACAKRLKPHRSAAL